MLESEPITRNWLGLWLSFCSMASSPARVSARHHIWKETATSQSDGLMFLLNQLPILLSGVTSKSWKMGTTIRVLYPLSVKFRDWACRKWRTQYISVKKIYICVSEGIESVSELCGQRHMFLLIIRDSITVHSSVWTFSASKSGKIWSNAEYSQIELHFREAESFLRNSQSLSCSRTFQHLMQLEGSLPSSQEPSYGLYTEPDQSSLHHPILSFQDPF
jgi:hypothetical protein